MIAAAFSLSLTKHINVIMYPLCAVIFYFYLPVLYASSRINILHHIKETKIWHIKFYPIELSAWFLITCFLSYILAHLLAGIFFLYRDSLYHFTYLLIILGLGGIVYCELDADNFHISAKQTIFKTQGRLLSFEFLFVMYLWLVTSQ